MGGDVAAGPEQAQEGGRWAVNAAVGGWAGEKKKGEALALLRDTGTCPLPWWRDLSCMRSILVSHVPCTSLEQRHPSETPRASCTGTGPLCLAASLLSPNHSQCQCMERIPCRLSSAVPLVAVPAKRPVPLRQGSSLGVHPASGCCQSQGCTVTVGRPPLCPSKPAGPVCCSGEEDQAGQPQLFGVHHQAQRAQHPAHLDGEAAQGAVHQGGKPGWGGGAQICEHGTARVERLGLEDVALGGRSA